jgi:hypothetical protein
VRDKKVFVTYWQHGHHQYDFPHIWCGAPPGEQEALIASAPHRFFRPPYVGGRGWIGVRLECDIDWDEIAELCVESYRLVAPASLIKLLDSTERG